jgi:heptosyltransferase-2
LNRFVELAQRLSPDWNLAVLGSARERGLGEAIKSNRPEVRNVCGDLQLRESLAVVASADAVVCNSSMLMHAAAAFRKPCVTLLGPIYTDAEQHQTQWGYPEPSVVLGRQSADDPLPEVDQVLSALIERVRT